MKKYLVLGVLVVTVLLAIPLSAAENATIKLPDGVYMYDSSVQRLEDGRDRVGFGKYFVVHNNNIYSSKEAVKKFGISKLNKLFGANKKYKILLGGELIGTKYNLRFDKGEGIDGDDAVLFCDESYLKKDIKRGPVYGDSSFGSAVRCMAVPEEYKEIKKKVYNTIPQEEVDKVSKLLKEKLFDLVKNRKEIKKNKVKDTDLVKEGIVLLDKIAHRNEEMYIGIYSYEFNVAANVCHAYKLVTCVPVFRIIFAARKDNVYVITSDYDEETLWNAKTTILGTLDVDGCGREELIIEKDFSGEDEILIHLEVYKQNDDGKWTLIQKNKWEGKR